MDLMAPFMARDAASPRITTYTDQGRMELSAATAANWAAKGGNLCIGELGLSPGDTAVVDCPTDWLPIAIVLGCWQAGVAVCSPSSPAASSAAVLFTTESDAEFTRDFGGEILLVSTDPFGRGVAESGGEVPFGMTDLAPELRIQGDRYTGPVGGLEDILLIDASERSISGSEIEARALASAGAGIRAVTDSWQDTDGLVARLLPLFAGGSVVLSSENTPDQSAHRARLTQLAVVEKGVLLQ